MNYFQQIIDLFSKHEFSKSGKKMFYGWLVDEEYACEKENALKQAWDATLAEPSNKTWLSYKDVKNKTGITRKNTSHSLRLWQTAAAISLILLLSTIYFYTKKYSPSSADLIEQYVPIAELLSITLPDGSEVQLNSQSVLLYPQNFDGKNRSVYLLGEANFKVKRDEKKPFVVKSSDFQVTVLGTEFDVCAYPEDSLVRTTVLSGSVKVEYDNLHSNAILSPNQQLVYHKKTKQGYLNNPNLADVTAWQRGELVFRGTTLKEIIGVLQRKYPFTFSYNLTELKNDKYTFRFKDNASFPEVMDIIVKVVGDIGYQIQENTCYIVAK